MSPPIVLMPEIVGPVVRPLLSLRGRLWVPTKNTRPTREGGHAYDVLLVKTETPTLAKIELYETTQPAKKKRLTSWNWYLEAHEGREHQGKIYGRHAINEMHRSGTVYANVEPDLHERSKAGELTSGEMWAQVHGRHVQIITDSLLAVAHNKGPVAGHGACCFCGRPLLDRDSKARGIGPECLERYMGVRANMAGTAYCVSQVPDPKQDEEPAQDAPVAPRPVAQIPTDSQTDMFAESVPQERDPEAADLPPEESEPTADLSVLLPIPKRRSVGGTEEERADEGLKMMSSNTQARINRIKKLLDALYFNTWSWDEYDALDETLDVLEQALIQQLPEHPSEVTSPTHHFD